MPIYSAREAKRGDALLASRLNEIEDALRRLENVRGGAGIDVRQTKGGLQIAATGAVDRVLAQADPAGAYIPPYDPDAGPPAQGQASAQSLDVTTALPTPTGRTITFFNTSARSIRPGDYFWAELDVFRTWHAVGAPSPTMLMQTKTVATYPTTAGAFYAASPVTITGTEGEGLAGSFAPDLTTTYYIYNLGASVPPAGTKVVASLVSTDRWVFVY